MVSPSAKQNVDEYSMSIHMGVCHGPIDAITGLFVGEKIAWTGEVTTEGSIYVNAPSLFGGPKDGGGVGGIMYYLPGSPTQVMPAALATRLGLTSATCPAFRGVASVFFIGNDNIPTGSVDVSGGTTAGGGGGGTTYRVGGDGSGADNRVDGGGCVATTCWLPDDTRAEALAPGSTLLALDYADMTDTTNATVKSAVIENHECVTLVSFSGITVTVSKTTPFTTRTGRMISVMDCGGLMAPVQDAKGFRWEMITDVLEAGRHDVIHVDAGGATFAAGDRQGAFIFTHNIAKS